MPYKFRVGDRVKVAFLAKEWARLPLGNYLGKTGCVDKLGEKYYHLKMFDGKFRMFTADELELAPLKKKAKKKGK